MSKTARRLRRLMPKSDAEWRTSTEPLAMLEVLRARGSDRKVRLFAVGCSRLAMADLIPERCHLAIEVAERYADKLASRDELLWSRTIAFQEVVQFSFGESEKFRLRGEHRRNLSDEEVRMYFLAESIHPFTPFKIGLLRHRLQWDLRLMGIAPLVLRDILGNPFRHRPVELRWRTHEVVDLTQAIYDDRNFARLPDLAVALQSSGCDDEDILGHCRQPIEHVRGCWVVDAILGKS